MRAVDTLPTLVRATIARLTSAGVTHPEPTRRLSPSDFDSAPTLWDGKGALGADDMPGAPLPRIRTSRDGQHADADLELGALLGEGGMGRVVLAIQKVFGRTVAVKSVKPDRLDASTVSGLVREARITGTLEHPNIVPAYLLAQSEDGPVLVMKRVQGVPWSTLIYGETQPGAAGGPSRDQLDRHLETLLKVCNAVEHAHRRGVVHRDLKPDNVMVGDLGEVYLVDWGVAVRLDGARSELPAGTPCYMAPEMLNGSIDVTPRTDVYLLGAVLHEVLTHAPRHAGSELEVVLRSVLESAPFVYDESVPRELAAICNRATAHDPEERFESALAFRDAIDAFLRHRGSLDLCAEGERDLQELQRLLGGASDRDDVRRLGTESDFAFRQAARVWPENPVARRGRQRCLELMIGFEIEQKNAPGAYAMLRQLPDPRPTLEKRIRDLEAAFAAATDAKAKLDRLGHETDPRVSAGSRMLFTVLVYSVLATILLALEVNRVTLTVDGLLVALAVVFCAYGAIIFATRRTLLATESNRRMHSSVLTGVVWGILITALGRLIGTPTDTMVFWWLSGFALCNIVMAIWSEPASAVLASVLIGVNCATALLIGALWPGHPFVVLAAACVGAVPIALVRAVERDRARAV